MDALAAAGTAVNGTVDAQIVASIVNSTEALAAAQASMLMASLGVGANVDTAA